MVNEISRSIDARRKQLVMLKDPKLSYVLATQAPPSMTGSESVAEHPGTLDQQQPSPVCSSLLSTIPITYDTST
jgi:hypothetical protein